MASEDRESSANENTDALKVIKGIGPAFSQALYKMGVTQVSDLVRYTPEELSQALQEQGIRVTPDRISSDDWIGQAQRLVDQNAAAQPEPDEGTETSQTSNERDQDETAQSTWRQRACFFLFFDYATDDDDEPQWQTRVYHDESGEEAQLRGVEPDAWVGWILKRAQLSEDTTVADSSGAGEEAGAQEVRDEPAQELQWTKMDALIDILDVQVAGDESVATEAEKQLLTTLRFQVVGAEAAALAIGRTAYRVEVRVVDIETGDPAYVKASVNNLEPDVQEHTVRLGIPVPEVGRYEFHSLVRLLPPVENVRAFYEGPTVRIVA